jgi:hypothetical protein
MVGLIGYFLHLNPCILPLRMRINSGSVGVSYAMRWRHENKRYTVDLVEIAIVADWNTHLAKSQGRSYAIVAGSGSVAFRT